MVKKREKPGKKENTDDLLEYFHPEGKICEIVKTSTAKKKNVFDSYRPKPGTCLDYSISQTETKLDAGTTKIHITQTKATYEELIELPPKPPKKIRCKGAPPREFIDEKWRREQEEMQKAYRDQVRNFASKKMKKSHIEMKKGHVSLLEMVGPEWYQELSPKQIAAIDQLKSSIIKDLNSNTITNTQENLATLGLVLRPNHNHIKKALIECCGCPVEFLLILYQLMGPKRESYSLNDRLLLSGVVHLSMKSTLKELHVRIPSPPKHIKLRLKEVTIRQKRKNYKSPYLVPFTFEPEPRKFNGVYVNKHLQYPESPYFSYLNDFWALFNQDTTLGEVGEDGEELYEELKVAHLVYEELFGIPGHLLKASLYTQCDNFRNRKKSGVELSPSSVFIYQGMQATSSGNCIRILGGVAKLHPAPEMPVYPPPEIIEEEIIDECTCVKTEKTCKKKIKKKCCGSSKLNKNKSTSNPNLDKTEDDNESTEDKSESKDDKEDEVGKEKIAEKSEEPPTPKIEEKEVPPQPEDKIEEEVPPAETPEKPEVIEESMPEKVPQFYKEPGCGCKSENLKTIENSKCPCLKCEEDRKKLSINYIISGIQESENSPPTKIIEGVSLVRPCECLKKYHERIETYDDYLKRQEMVRNFKKLEHKYNVGGVVNTANGPVFQINGMRPMIDCKCAQFQREQLAEEEMAKRMPHIPPGRIKYGISGVKETPDGNVYILSHAIDMDECDCMKLYDKYSDKHSRCMTMYQKYLQKMKDDFNDYMDEIKPAKTWSSQLKVAGTDTSQDDNLVDEDDEEEHVDVVEEHGEEEVPEEIPPAPEEKKEKKSCSCRQKSNKETAEEIPEEIPEDNPEENPEEIPEKILPATEEKDEKKSCSCQKKKPDEAVDAEEIQEELPENSEEVSEAPEETVEPSEEISVEEESTSKDENSEQVSDECGEVTCTCPPKEVPRCTCNDPEPPVEEEEIIEEPRRELKRYVIVKKIPCNLKAQQEILKKALNGMAEDGYPLAILPDSYKLPHFKLWMQKRCGKFWTQKDRIDYVKISRNMWKHTDTCRRKVDMAKLQISRTRAKTLTWFNADYCRQLVSDAVLDYYRRVRQDNIAFGREFFPTMFDYEFPTKTFRDCYFAYTPSKEEDVLAAFVWQPFEVKDFSKRKSCFCN